MRLVAELLNKRPEQLRLHLLARYVCHQQRRYVVHFRDGQWYMKSRDLARLMKKPSKRHVSQQTRRWVLDNSGWCCAQCSQLLYNDIAHVDHVEPVHISGDNSLDNLQALCVVCHAKKTASERRHNRLQSKRRATNTIIRSTFFPS